MVLKDELAQQRRRRTTAQLGALGVSPAGIQKLFATGMSPDCLLYIAAMARSVREICGSDVGLAQTVLGEIPTNGSEIFAAYDLEGPPSEPPLALLVEAAVDIASDITLPPSEPEILASSGPGLAEVIPLHTRRRGRGKTPPPA